MGMLDVQTDGLTWRDLDERFPELDRRELHDGVLVVSPSPAVGHQRVVGRLLRALAEWTDQHGGEVLVGPVDVVTAEQRSTSLICCCPRGAPRVARGQEGA